MPTESWLADARWRCARAGLAPNFLLPSFRIPDVGHVRFGARTDAGSRRDPVFRRHRAGGGRGLGRWGLTSRADGVVLVVTAGVALWNMGAAYVAGLALYHASARGWVRL